MVSANAWLGAMIAGTAVVMLVGARSAPEPEPPAAPVPETPWLTKEAADQLFGDSGRPGPLFSEVMLGGPAPSAEVQARIAEFARVNDVRIDLDIVAGDLAAIRFEVAYSGCCGYEGADVLGLRLRRPETDECCGCEESWIDDWAVTHHDGVHMRGRVRVNRVMVRWEQALSLDEILERADELIGLDAATVMSRAGDRWIDLDGPRALIEMPYELHRPSYDLRPRGITVTIESGRIVEAELSTRDYDSDGWNGFGPVVRSRWGRPVIGRDGDWTWRKPGRRITAHVDSSELAIRVTR